METIAAKSSEPNPYHLSRTQDTAIKMNQPFSQSNSPLPGQSVRIKPSGPIAQILSILIVLALLVIGILVFIPLIVIAIVLGLIFIAYFKIKRAFSRAHNPNGPLDGRRNVRVVDRDE